MSQTPREYEIVEVIELESDELVEFEALAMCGPPVVTRGGGNRLNVSSPVSNLQKLNVTQNPSIRR